MNIFQTVGHWISNIFKKGYDAAKSHGKLAVDIVNTIKQVVDSPMTQWALDLLPTKLPGDILAKVKPIVDKVAVEIALDYQIITDAQTQSDAMGAIIDHLKKQLKGGRVGFWMDLSARLNVALADNKISLAEAAALAQMIYAEFYGQSPATDAQAPAVTETSLPNTNQ